MNTSFSYDIYISQIIDYDIYISSTIYDYGWHISIHILIWIYRCKRKSQGTHSLSCRLWDPEVPDCLLSTFLTLLVFVLHSKSKVFSCTEPKEYIKVCLFHLSKSGSFSQITPEYSPLQYSISQSTGEKEPQMNLELFFW